MMINVLFIIIFKWIFHARIDLNVLDYEGGKKKYFISSWHVIIVKEDRQKINKYNLNIFKTCNVDFVPMFEMF